MDLPRFTVITGLNGSGKSHLLNAIKLGHVVIPGVKAGVDSNQIRRYDWSNLIPGDTGHVDLAALSTERSQHWRQLEPALRAAKHKFQQSLTGGHSASEVVDRAMELLSLSESEALEQLYIDAAADHSGDVAAARQTAEVRYKQLRKAEETAKQAARAQFGQQDRSRGVLFDKLCSAVGLSVLQITEDSFYANYPLIWDISDPFQQSFGRLFSSYHRKWLDNVLAQAMAQRGEDIPWLSDGDFQRKWGPPPWDVVNQILRRAKLEFQINRPRGPEERSYEPRIWHEVNEIELKFGDLSSGERILMSFALCLYQSEDGRQLVDYPKVLLFDEIDAPLHPSMTKSLLDAISSVLIEQHGIDVILTTHSPSTVALAPEESLYVMNPTGARMEKTTKDRALAIITSGVPTLSIDYENRRQVFVESKYDAKAYGRIFEQLRSHLIPEISLHFISSGSGGSGDCTQVREVVGQLTKGGSRTAFGIVDWDGKHNDTEFVKVLACGSRYSLESCLLDPFVMSVLLHREGALTKSDLGFGDGEKPTDIEKLAIGRLTSIADALLSRLPIDKSDQSTIQCEYLGLPPIELPAWFPSGQITQPNRNIFPQHHLRHADKVSLSLSQVLTRGNLGCMLKVFGTTSGREELPWILS